MLEASLAGFRDSMRFPSHGSQYGSIGGFLLPLACRAIADRIDVML